MDALLPLFPLGTVAIPGSTVPLHVFEERYRDLVSDLLAEPDPEARRFGIVAIREGYEVGAHQARSMYRTGCLMQLTSAERHDDGRYDVVAVGRSRFRVLETDTTRSYLRARVEGVGEALGGSAAQIAEAVSDVLGVFAAYRGSIAGLAALGPPPTLPRDPTELSYALGSATLLPLGERQRLLEASTTLDRLALVRRQLNAELQAMRALPSLPATEIARSGWSPN
jgi:uncharacterized protein